ncbi:MAG: Hsp20/alpha crystallin family protein [Bacteroidales bacterium]
MAIIKRSNPEFPSFPSLFDNLWSRDWMDWTNLNYSNTNTTLPAVNVIENDDEFKIELAAPGMTKGDFRINLEGNVLTISSEKKMEKEDKKENYTRREFSYQSFQRSFTLPEHSVEREKVAANYKDGILHIQIPKKEEARPKSREIDIT